MDNGDEGDYEGVVQTAGLAGGIEDVYSPPKPDSPRTIWSRENRAMLAKKEEEEKKAKEELMAKARDYKAAFTKDRSERIAKTKRINREDESKAQELKEKPEGSVWEQIIHMIDFNLGVQQKDVSRARALLFQAKDANLSLKE